MIRSIGYTGGIDLSFGRYDTNNHAYMDPLRISHSDEPNRFEDKKMYYPWHDATVKVNGKVAIEMANSFIEVIDN